MKSSSAIDWASIDPSIVDAAEKRIPLRVLAERFGIKEDTIRRHGRLMGLTFRARAVQPDWYSQAEELWKQGMLSPDIAKTCGVSLDCVHVFLCSRGLKGNINAISWHAEAATLCDQGKSNKEIAQALKMPSTAIRSFMSRYRAKTGAASVSREPISEDPTSKGYKPTFAGYEPSCWDWDFELDEENDNAVAEPDPVIPKKMRVPCVVVIKGRLIDQVVHGGRIVSRFDDFHEAFRYQESLDKYSIVARAKDYVALRTCKPVRPSGCKAVN